MTEAMTKSNKPDPKKFEEFINRIKNEESFPQTMSEIVLQRYLKISFNIVDNAFALLKTGLEMRSKQPFLFTDRDLTAQEIQTACGVFQFVPLPKLTKEKYKVTIIRFHKCDANLYDTAYVIKTALMMFDACYSIYDNEDGFVEGEIFILDVDGFSFKQFLDCTKNARIFKFYTNFLQEGAPVTLKCNYVVNTSSIVDGLMGLVKPILSPEVNELVKFLRYGKGVLEFIDKEILPADYGGDEKSINELYEDWLEVFKTKREYLMQDENWKLKEKDQ